MTVCKYRDVSERDMDLLFMEAFVTDPDFSKLFLEKTEHAGKPFETRNFLQRRFTKILVPLLFCKSDCYGDAR